MNLIALLILLGCDTSQGIKGSRILALSSQRKMLISSSVSNYKTKGGKNKSKQHGSSQMSYFLLCLCSNNMQNENLPQIIIFPLPFRFASRNFKDSIRKKSYKNHRNHIAFESAKAGGVLCWLKLATFRLLYFLSVVQLCEWEIQRQLYNFQFRLPQRKKCI